MRPNTLKRYILIIKKYDEMTADEIAPKVIFRKIGKKFYLSSRTVKNIVFDKAIREEISKAGGPH